MRSPFQFIIHKWPVGWCVHDGCHIILEEAEQQGSVQKSRRSSGFKYNWCKMLKSKCRKLESYIHFVEVEQWWLQFHYSLFCVGAEITFVLCSCRFFQDGNGYIDEQELDALLRDLYQTNKMVRCCLSKHLLVFCEQQWNEHIDTRWSRCFSWDAVRPGLWLLAPDTVVVSILCLLFRRWTWRTCRATSKASWVCLTEGSSTAASWKLSCAGSQLCDSSYSVVAYHHFLCLPRPALPRPHPRPAAWQHIPSACAR